MTETTTGTREHVRALERVHSGEAADANAYIAAVEASAFDLVLEDVGGFVTDDEEIVTRDLLERRANEILVEKGFMFTSEGDGGLTWQMQGIPDEVIREAARVAVEELGRVGEKRKDTAARAKARRERLVDDAIVHGKIAVTARAGVLAEMERSPEAVSAALAALQPAESLVALVSVRDGRVELPDEASYDMHTRAERIREQRGWTDDYAGYSRALEAAERQLEREKAEAAEAAEAAKKARAAA